MRGVLGLPEQCAGGNHNDRGRRFRAPRDVANRRAEKKHSKGEPTSARLVPTEHPEFTG